MSARLVREAGRKAVCSSSVICPTRRHCRAVVERAGRIRRHRHSGQQRRLPDVARYLEEISDEEWDYTFG